MSPAILFVDDEQSICSALQRVFRKEDFRIFSANSGKEALDLIQHNDIDVIVSDQKMPGMSGTELLKIVKEQHPNIRRIILSGHSDFKDLTDAINEANISHFLQKPWRDEHLVETIKNTIETKIQPPKLSTKTSPPQKNSGITNNHYQPSPAITALINDTYYINLEKDIKNDHLTLKSKIYASTNEKNEKLYNYQLSWPAFTNFCHGGIINIAYQSGYSHDLFTWYLLAAHEMLTTKSNNGEKRIVDLFSESFSHNRFTYDLLATFLNTYENIVLRIPFDFIKKKSIRSLLPHINSNKHSLLVSLEKRIITMQDLDNLPINFIEIDCRQSSMENGLLAEKRLNMINYVQNEGIKVVLAECISPSQQDYALHMNVDYF